MSANPSDLEVSRQRNIELVAENFDLKSEVANFRKEQKSSVEKQERKIQNLRTDSQKWIRVPR